MDMLSYPLSLILRKELIVSNLEARGVEPLFVTVYLGMSADVLLERIPQQSERGGLPRMATDVITFGITGPFYG